MPPQNIWVKSNGKWEKYSRVKTTPYHENPSMKGTAVPKRSNDPIIRDLLKLMPNSLYVTPDGSALYVLVPDEWETVLEFTGPDFSVMTDEDVLNYIASTVDQIAL